MSDTMKHWIKRALIFTLRCCHARDQLCSCGVCRRLRSWLQETFLRPLGTLSVYWMEDSSCRFLGGKQNVKHNIWLSHMFEPVVLLSTWRTAKEYNKQPHASAALYCSSGIADVFSVISFLVFVFFYTTAFSFHFVSSPNFSFLPLHLLFSHFFASFLYSSFLSSLPSLHFCSSSLYCFLFLLPFLLFCSSYSCFFFLFILLILVSFLLFFHPSFPLTPYGHPFFSSFSPFFNRAYVELILTSHKFVLLRPIRAHQYKVSWKFTHCFSFSKVWIRTHRYTERVDRRPLFLMIAQRVQWLHSGGRLA